MRGKKGVNLWKRQKMFVLHVAQKAVRVEKKNILQEAVVVKLVLQKSQPKKVLLN